MNNQNVYKMKQNDIEEKVKAYLGDGKPVDRYRSFDYCYNYFWCTKDFETDIEKSCLVLSSYLASWGMYRGSSFLLKEKSLYHFKSIIEHISKLKRENSELWLIDVDSYTNENIDKILITYKEIENLFTEKHTSRTLVTKILLGVFGFVPAFDENFIKGFKSVSVNKKPKFSTLNIDNLKFIKDFYDNNQKEIDLLSIQTKTINFNTGEKSDISYTKAKIIDMYGFQIGLEIKMKEKS